MKWILRFFHIHRWKLNYRGTQHDWFSCPKCGALKSIRKQFP